MQTYRLFLNRQHLKGLITRFLKIINDWKWLKSIDFRKKNNCILNWTYLHCKISRFIYCLELYVRKVNIDLHSTKSKYTEKDFFLNVILSGYLCFPTLATGPWPQFVYNGPCPNLSLTAPVPICIYRPQSLICIYQLWPIRIGGNNKS